MLYISISPVARNVGDIAMLLVPTGERRNQCISANISKTNKATAANAKATMVSMGVSVLVVREVDPAERSEASIRARRSFNTEDIFAICESAACETDTCVARASVKFAIWLLANCKASTCVARAEVRFMI